MYVCMYIYIYTRVYASRHRCMYVLRIPVSVCMCACMEFKCRCIFSNNVRKTTAKTNTRGNITYIHLYGNYNVCVCVTVITN